MKGFATCICVLPSFTTIPDPTVITFTQEQTGRELQTPVLSIKSTASRSSPSPPSSHWYRAFPCAKYAPSHCNALTHVLPHSLSVLTHSLKHRTGRTRHGGVPISSYSFGAPRHDSVFYTPPMGRIGVHHPREIVQVEREIVQFVSVYPMELEGHDMLSST